MRGISSCFAFRKTDPYGKTQELQYSKESKWPNLDDQREGFTRRVIDMEAEKSWKI